MQSIYSQISLDIYITTNCLTHYPFSVNPRGRVYTKESYRETMWHCVCLAGPTAPVCVVGQLNAEPPPHRHGGCSMHIGSRGREMLDGCHFLRPFLMLLAARCCQMTGNRDVTLSASFERPHISPVNFFPMHLSPVHQKWRSMHWRYDILAVSHCFPVTFCF